MHVAEQPDLLTVREMRRTWIEKVLPYAEAEALRLRRFTSDDIRDALMTEDMLAMFGGPESANHFGAMISRLVFLTGAKEVKRVKSSRKTRNNAKITVYEIR